ncbi:hypothetical protein QO004_003054 [Rhizobium mesoamericanum]|nr:hypothetical protein [Rhizobium mesoamericanum]
MAVLRRKATRLYVMLVLVLAAAGVGPFAASFGQSDDRCVTAHAAEYHRDMPPSGPLHCLTCCIGMHCCPVIPHGPVAMTFAQSRGAVFTVTVSANPLLLIRPIDPPPKPDPA